MDFSFYEQYKNSSTVDLLLIVKQPTKYQQAAVDAAKMILQERVVSETEEQEAEELLLQGQKKSAGLPGTYQGVESLSELLDPLTEPSGAKKEMLRSVLVGLILVTLYHVWVIFVQVRGIYYFFSGYYPGNYFFIISLVMVAYIVAMLVLLWKRHAWGWRLLFTYSLFQILNVAWSTWRDLLTDLPNWDAWSLVLYFYPTVLKLLLLYLMWNDTVAAQFSIYRPQKRKTLLWSVIIFGAIGLMIYILLSDIKIIS